MSIEHIILVACSNANGQSDMFRCTLDVSETEAENGEHYDAAIVLAKEEGYEGPFVCFDETEHQHIARHVETLACPIPFTLTDYDDKDRGTQKGSLRMGDDGILIRLDGHTDKSSTDNTGVVALVEFWEQNTKVRLYSDINTGEPTHSVSLEGARNEARDPDESDLEVAIDMEAAAKVAANFKPGDLAIWEGREGRPEQFVSCLREDGDSLICGVKGIGEVRLPRSEIRHLLKLDSNSTWGDVAERIAAG